MNTKRYVLSAFISVIFMMVLAFVSVDLAQAGPYSPKTLFDHFIEATGYGGTGAAGAIVVQGPTNGPTNPFYVDSTRTYLTSAAGSGATSLNVASSSGFSTNDEILVIQMLGADAGKYETRIVSSVPNGSTINLSSALSDSYPTYLAGSTVTQVLRVPQYTSVTINSGGYMSARAFNGQTGGVLFFRASGNVTINYNATYSGRIVATGLGYSGGGASSSGSGPGGGGVGQGGSNTSPGSGPVRVVMGSGGGGSSGAGGNGGGIVMMKVGGTLTVDGIIIADGASGGSNAGGGAGGTINVSAASITRSSTCGPMTANGGAGNGSGTTGSGGRIFMGYSISNDCRTATPNAVYPKFKVK